MTRPTSRPKPIPLDRARELFELDPAGRLVRRIARGRAPAGADAVRIQWDERFKECRAVVWIDGEKFQAPRILLSLHLGRVVPVRLVVDHINGDPLDNRVENLRAITRTANQLNRHDNRRAPTTPDGEVDPW